MPRSLKDFLETIAKCLRVELPSVLVDYASGIVRSPSLLPGSIDRINGDPTVYTSRRIADSNTKANNPFLDLCEAYSRKTRFEKEPRWMCDLRNAFRIIDVELTKKAIGKIQRSSDTTPSGKQLCSLTKKLLSGPAYSGDPLSYSSIKCCILTIARRFAIQKKYEDPVGYTKTTLEQLYRLAVVESAEDSTSPHRLQRIVAWALRQYHWHLVEEYDAKKINEEIAFPYKSGSDPVDAHILSVDEIFQAIEYIEVSRNRRWKRLYRTIARGQIIIFFLGGLRRAEGLGLMPSDMLPGPLCEVMVRDNDSRTLKTKNAYRRVVLGALAHPFPELLDPVYALFREAASRKTDLSCGISDDVIVPIIHEALQAVTESKECHLHTLRHSAAHWMFMRLMLADLDRIPEIFPHLPKTTLLLKAAPEFRWLLLHNDHAMNDHAWAVAVTMGHSNPDKVTLRYYVHCQDLLTNLFLEARTKQGTPATRDELRSLSGLPQRTANSQLLAPEKHNDNTDRAAAMDEKARDDSRSFDQEKAFVSKIFCKRLGLTIRSSWRSAPSLTQSRFWLKDTYDILWMSCDLGLSSDKLATIFGLDRQVIDAMLSRADSLLRTQKISPLAEQAGSPEDVSNQILFDQFVAPKPPKPGFNSEILHRRSAAIEEAVDYNSKRTSSALKYMALNIIPTFAQIVFAEIPRPELMSDCLSVFRALGFQRDDLYAITCDGTMHARPSRKWLRRWGLSWRINATNQFGQNCILMLPPPWVAVGPKAPKIIDDHSQRDQAKAILFMIRIAAIRYAV
jgi:hypothetical protein